MPPVRVMEWFVRDLKSLGAARLPLRRLDLLTGPNSSGKSSLIQSILFATQSLTRAEILLNGPLVRFGGAKDAIRDGMPFMELGAKIDLGIDETIDCECNWQLSDSKGELRLTKLTAHWESGEIFEATDSYLSDTTRTDLLRQFGGDGVLRIKSISGSRAPARSYIIFKGLLPIWVVTPFNYNAFLQRHSRSASRRDRSADLRDYSAAYPGIFEDLGLELKSPARRPWFIIDRLEELAGDRYEKVLETLAQRLRNHGWDPVHIDNSAYHPSTDRRLGRLEDVLAFLGFISDSMNSFARQVKYLGPLRDEPRVISPSGSLSPATPVGVKGEYAADYLSSVKDRVVHIGSPDGQLIDTSVGDALGLWLQYLELGDEVKVLDQGKLGKGFVLAFGDSERDLTMVGVGASQILPVLLLVVSAEADSVLIIEQPELHLHPAVQSRLADFLLFARPDVRILVETHSEYMVTRVRLRVAKETAQPDDVSILFVEKGANDSAVRHLDFTSVGSLAEWPTGFFDTHDQDGAEILESIAQRISKTRGSHGHAD